MQVRHDEELAQRAYDALRTAGKLRSHRLLAYRCPRRCLLLEVVNFPQPLGIVLHQPRYKLSPGVNASASTPEGRRANTEDGDRRWQAQTRPIGPDANANLQCDHLLDVVIDHTRIRGDLQAGRSEVTITQADHTPPRQAGAFWDD